MDHTGGDSVLRGSLPGPMSNKPPTTAKQLEPQPTQSMPLLPPQTANATSSTSPEQPLTEEEALAAKKEKNHQKNIAKRERGRKVRAAKREAVDEAIRVRKDLKARGLYVKPQPEPSKETVDGVKGRKAEGEGEGEGKKKKKKKGKKGKKEEQEAGEGKEVALTGDKETADSSNSLSISSLSPNQPSPVRTITPTTTTISLGTLPSSTADATALSNIIVAAQTTIAPLGPIKPETHPNKLNTTLTSPTPSHPSDALGKLYGSREHPNMSVYMVGMGIGQRDRWRIRRGLMSVERGVARGRTREIRYLEEDEEEAMRVMKPQPYAKVMAKNPKKSGTPKKKKHPTLKQLAFLSQIRDRRRLTRSRKLSYPLLNHRSELAAIPPPVLPASVDPSALKVGPAKRALWPEEVKAVYGTRDATWDPTTRASRSTGKGVMPVDMVQEMLRKRTGKKIAKGKKREEKLRRKERERELREKGAEGMGSADGTWGGGSVPGPGGAKKKRQLWE